jgi:hypothetical protein
LFFDCSAAETATLSFAVVLVGIALEKPPDETETVGFVVVKLEEDFLLLDDAPAPRLSKDHPKVELEAGCDEASCVSTFGVVCTDANPSDVSSNFDCSAVPLLFDAISVGGGVARHTLSKREPKAFAAAPAATEEPEEPFCEDNFVVESKSAEGPSGTDTLVEEDNSVFVRFAVELLSS